MSRKARSASKLAGLAMCTVALAACGTTTTVKTITSGGTPSSKVSPSTAVQVNITSPAQGSTSNATMVDVRGTVSPANATVEVAGQNAQVGNGVFSASVPLSSGTNEIDVIASAPGSSPANTSVDVTKAAPKPKAKPKPQVTTVTRTTTSTTTPPPPSYGGNCGGGVSVNSNTSCPFADNVESAYSGPGVEYVYSPVTGDSYAMDCEPTGTGYIQCTGGNNAEVEFPG